MKNGFLKLVTLSTLIVVGGGLVSNTSKEATPLEAATHQTNFDPYTYVGTYYDNLKKDGSQGLLGTFAKDLGSYVFPKYWYDYSSGLATECQGADEDPTNKSNMIYFYTRDSVRKNSASTWNREHVWPQSLSTGNSGQHWGKGKAGCDLLHIRPTYNSTNSDRGNKLYADTGKATPKVYNGMTYGYTSGNYFEPLDCTKGDAARIIMYVWTTYYYHYNDTGLKITNVFKDYNTLLKWHMEDKPDVLEGYRNDYSEKSKQKNRNPFVDHPEYAWMIFGDKVDSTIYEQCKTTYPGNGSVVPVKQVKSIAISGEPNKKDYYVGDTFDPTGLTITAVYDDDTTGEINPSNCIWIPTPLTEGLTMVTCQYYGHTANYTGITVTKPTIPPVDGDTFSAEFKTNSNDEGTRLTGSEVMSKQLVNNTLFESCTCDSTGNIFPGTRGLKLGSSSKSGDITFAFKTVASRKIVKLEIQTARFGTDSTTVTVKLDSNTVGTFVGGDTYTVAMNKVNGSILNITTTKRVYLTKIIVTVDNNDVPPPGPISSSSSSVPPISSSTNNPISSTSEQPISSSEVITSVDSNSSEETPISSSSNSNNNTNKKKGCHGSLLAVTAATSIAALVGITLIFSKKKEK